MKLLSFLILIILAAMPLSAQVTTPEQMPNVQVANRNNYVSDPAGLLSAQTTETVNRRLSELRSKTSVEAVVAIPPEIGDEEPAEWCEQLFTSWGIGKKDKDNGVLLMISPGSRCAFIMTGYGVEGVLTDFACKNIINRAVIPAMRDDDLNAAVNNATQLMVQALEDPAVAEELRSKDPDNFSGAIQTLDTKYLLVFVKFFAGTLFLFALGLFISDLINVCRKSDNYERAEQWRSHLKTYFWLGVLSLGSGLLFFLLAYLVYRRWRTKPLKCPNCGTPMRRLSETEDNQYLSPGQDLEEQLGSVDYDVWKCPKCHTVERFPFKSAHTQYTECPVCHTVAMCLKCDMTVRPATTRSEGEGVKIYECKFCHHQDRKPYRIPRKADPAAAAVAGAVIGSAIGRGGRGGGGGGFGGGFGGGATGGGGAGGSW